MCTGDKTERTSSFSLKYIIFKRQLNTKDIKFQFNSFIYPTIYIICNNICLFYNVLYKQYFRYKQYVQTLINLFMHISYTVCKYTIDKYIASMEMQAY
jgi:hypothetical protein